MSVHHWSTWLNGFQHIQPLYVTTLVHDVKLIRELVDPGFWLDIKPLLTLKAMGIAGEHVVEQLIRCFEGGVSLALGYINVDLAVGPIQAASHFHVINARPSYHLLPGRP